MRVLLINPHVFKGGVENVVVSTANWLNKFGIHCDVLTLSLELEKATSEHKEIRFFLPSMEIGYSLNQNIYGTAKKSILELQKLCLAINSVIHNYDVLNPHSFPSSWACYLVKKPSYAKVVWTCHDVFGVYGTMRSVFEKSWVLRNLLRISATFDKHVVNKCIDTIITVSNIHAKEILHTYGRQPHIIPPGIEIESYVDGDGELFRERYNLSNSFLAIHVGNLIPRKSQDISIKAVAILKNLVPDIRLAIVGDGPDIQKLRKLTLDLNLRENVVFTGKITDRDLKDAYKAADVNLLPSTLESFGLTPIEALASGTISIVARETGVSEYIERYGIGYVLSTREPSELARLILHVYRKRGETEGMVRKAQDILREKFSWKNYVENLLEVYETMN